jgi:hypothetical protein
MNPELDKQLEAETERLLKDLPDLAAPPDLVLRTINLIVQPPSPWHSRPWFGWPAGFRVAYLLLMAGALAGAFFAWRALGPGLFGAMTARFSRWTADVGCLWNALSAMTGAVSAILDYLGKGFVLSCVGICAFAYAACVGFGTAFVRLVLAGPRKNHV